MVMMFLVVGQKNEILLHIKVRRKDLVKEKANQIIRNLLVISLEKVVCKKENSAL